MFRRLQSHTASLNDTEVKQIDYKYLDPISATYLINNNVDQFISVDINQVKARVKCSFGGISISSKRNAIYKTTSKSFLFDQYSFIEKQLEKQLKKLDRIN